jgi:hypothetical protein
MNIYTILGAALFNPDIRRLLFENPAEAARALGLVITTLEIDALKKLVVKGGDDLETLFIEVQKGICPKPPCPFRLGTCEEEASSTAAD